MTPERVRIRLEPLAVEVDVPMRSSLAASLAEHGIEFPCGGLGTCGGCCVRILSGSLPVTDADRATFTPDQLAGGWRLACQANADQPLVLECAQWRMEILADSTAAHDEVPSGSETKLGIAIDLGTTTIAAQIVDLASGKVLGLETALNPQAVFGTDVMSRIRAVLDGEDLASPIRKQLGQLVALLAAGRQERVAGITIVGNTVMHHLFCVLDVKPLSRAPFHSPNLGEQRFAPCDLGWELPADCVISFARCLGGFVGSDILAGIIATGIGQGDDLAALVDLGTNGEIAIGNRHGIVCASTAAGPAFEAGAIRMGMRAVTGAISHVSFNSGTFHATVIGDVEPRGICGSGLVDAAAAGLRSGAILPSGRIADGTKLFPVTPPVVLCQADIRELQLAKAAIAAGFRLVLKRLGASADGLSSIHLAGAFGNYVQFDSAIALGMIEAPRALLHPAGNTALRGAKMLLAGVCAPMPAIEHFSLAADPAFQDEFADCIVFPVESALA